MRFAKYILMFVAFAVATACTMTDVDEVVVAPVQSQDIKIVSRILPFADYDVSTRAAKNSKETEAKTLDFVILGASGDCIFYKHTDGDTTISLDKEADFGQFQEEEYKNCGIYILVNYPKLYNKVIEEAINEGVSSTDVYIKEYIVGKQNGYYFAGATPVEPTSQIPETGLPMYGSKTNVDLSNFANGEAITVPVESLYSKIVFDISVNPTQSSPKTPVFKLESYTINNLAATIDILGGTESVRVEDDTKAYVTVTTKTSGSSDNVDVQAAVPGDLTGVDTKADQEVSFSFYLPERFLQAGDVDEFVYPFGSSANIRQEDARYRQRYKPLLAQGYKAYNEETPSGEDSKATYVTFSGVFTDHQGHSYDVSYDVYVGNDSYSNFDIVRNRQYNNSIVIRGIAASSDQATNVGAISIDHRVNITRTQPAIINLRRETLLDSHFEVRPLRIRANVNDADYISKTVTHAQISVDVDWMRLEHKNSAEKGDATYCTNGKRKYFTTNLVTGNKNAGGLKDVGQTIVVPLTDSNQTVWIYVDENLAVGDNIRLGNISVQYGKVTNDTFVANSEKDPVAYTISQRNLYSVATTRNAAIDGSSTRSTEYYIEYEEEYLYDFDAEDSFGKTDQNGMAWGLDGVQLSHSEDAAIISQSDAGLLTSIVEWLGSGSGLSLEKLSQDAFAELPTRPFYDFYIYRDVKALDAPEDNDLTVRNFSGYEFNNAVIAPHLREKYPAHQIESDADANGKECVAKIDKISLDQQPKSAFAYCYNRNKRNANGVVETIKWYLPAIDEIEDIAENAYDFKGGVFQGNLYWSCQPAYNKHRMDLDAKLSAIFTETSRFYADYYTDNTGRARATKALYTGRVDAQGNPIYDPEDSGVPGYSGTQGGNVNISLNWRLQFDVNFDIPDTKYVPNGTLDYSNYLGNKARTDKARVRCVRIDTNAVN